MLRTLDALAVLWLSLLGGLLLWTEAPVAWGWQPRVVLSASMTPALHPGDVVLTALVSELDALPTGRVVAVTDPHLAAGSYLHRVVGHPAQGFVTTHGGRQPQCGLSRGDHRPGAGPGGDGGAGGRPPAGVGQGRYAATVGRCGGADRRFSRVHPVPPRRRPRTTTQVRSADG
jgi:hypothetical protein